MPANDETKQNMPLNNGHKSVGQNQMPYKICWFHATHGRKAATNPAVRWVDGRAVLIGLEDPYNQLLFDKLNSQRVSLKFLKDSNNKAKGIDFSNGSNQEMVENVLAYKRTVLYHKLCIPF